MVGEYIAKYLNIPCRAHVPSGKYTPELLVTQKNGATIIQHKPGYNSVIIKRAKDDTIKHKEYTYVPFGMECHTAVALTQNQVQNIPKQVERIVVPVGSAMSLAGILKGLEERNYNIPVLGIMVGANPTKRLNEYAPTNWREMVKLIKSEDDYHVSRKDVFLGEIPLDATYEAKCLNYLQPNDLFWIVGNRYLS
jgi:cysteine synthase